jgi:predicted AAA+ superfamily ATPase
VPAADLSLLARESPWWADPAAIDRDPQIRAVEAAPLAWQPPFPFAGEPPAVYTLRGPRQVGKTTLLKLFVRHLIRASGCPPRSILYLDCERAGISSPLELADTLRTYLGWAEGSESLYLCLDEVTRVPDWASAVRGLADAGLLRSSVMIATGSHALDIRRGGERMPGRRGRAGQFDYLLLPLSFRDYVGLRSPDVAGRLPALESLEDTGALWAAAREASLHEADLRAHFDRYLATGGFLSAVSRESQAGLVTEDLYIQHRDALVGEVVRTGHKEGYFRELIRWLWPRLGREFTWRDIAGATEIGTHVTARDYVEDLEELFVWHVYHRVKDPDRRSPAFKSPKKLYPVDPFTFHTLYAWGQGAVDPWGCTCGVLADPEVASRVVEGLVADHLRRAYGGNCFYYRSRGGREIDFVAFGEGGRRVATLEVKWRDRIEARDWRPVAERGGGVILTRSLLKPLSEDPATVAVPAHVLMSVFTGAATLKPVRYAD